MRFAAALFSFAVIVGCGGQGSSERGAAPASVASGAKRLQLVYEVDLDQAIADRYRTLQRDLQAVLDDRKIRAAVVATRDEIKIALDDAAKKPDVEAMLKSEYDGQVELQACPAVCLRISAPAAAAIKKAGLHNAVDTIRQRLDALKVKGASVAARGEQIVVEVDASEQRVRAMVARSGKLEFKIVDSDSEYMRSLYTVATKEPRAKQLGITPEIDQWQQEMTGSFSTDYFLVAADRATLETYVAELAKRDPRYVVPEDRQLGYERIGTQWRTYYLERSSELTGAYVTNAVGVYDPTTNRPLVLLDFSRAGAELLADITARNVGRKLAAVLDDQVRSAPIINSTIRGGRVSITMGGNDPAQQEKERDELIDVLKTGSLPAPLREVSSTPL